MKQTDLLSATTMVSVLLLALHISQDIVFGFDRAGLNHLIGVSILVVVACGAWHTPLLLLRSGVGHPRWVGRGMTLHPGFRVLARFDQPVEGWKGALQSAYSDAFEHEGITLTGLFVPTGVLGATMPGVGVEHTRNAANIGHLAMFGGILHDEGGATVRPWWGREPLVTYRMSPRDRDRLADCRRRTNVLPLGSGALAGSSLPIDRERVREALGFEGVAANSLDGASDRDFVCELAFVIALCAVHLSQWAEEWTIYSTQEFGFLVLPEGFCTGSSIMPQKINPDVLELVRGKSARTIGNVQALLVLLKGLPTAYNRDLQEDKEAIFDSIDTLEAVLGVAAPLVAGTKFDHARVTATIERGHLDATSLMEALIAAGVPQRTAHETVGHLVRRAMAKGVSLAELSDQEFTREYAGWNASLRGALGASRAVERMTSFGSTAPARVADQIAVWQRRLA